MNAFTKSYGNDKIDVGRKHFLEKPRLRKESYQFVGEAEDESLEQKARVKKAAAATLEHEGAIWRTLLKASVKSKQPHRR